MGPGGVSAPWMARLSLQGRTCGVPARPHPSGPTDKPLSPPTHEGLRRSLGHYFAGDIHMSMIALNTSVPARSRTLTVTGSA